jgi:hypothetical protein
MCALVLQLRTHGCSIEHLGNKMPSIVAIERLPSARVAGQLPYGHAAPLHRPQVRRVLCYAEKQ